MGTERSEELPFIAALGASAGGLEALTAVFDACPNRTGMAFIVIQHLSPDHESLMPELLSRHVEMTVVHPEDGTVPAPDTIYVIRPKTVLTFEEGKLRVRATRKEPGRLSLPINALFESLAGERADHCALVVLSGTGSDGSKGLREGKQASAITIAQAPDTARFDGMPKAAIATGYADLTLSPADIIPNLVEMLEEGKTAYFSPESSHMERALPRILAGVRLHSGIDFAHYKPATIVRRVQRRLRELEVADMREYARRVQDDKEEALRLRNELLIGVTRFLRDEGAIEAVRTVAIPRMLANTKGDLRLWVPGCSTGEEVYSLAMLVQEALEEAGSSRQFRLFATDVDETAIEHASLGEYGPQAAEQLPQTLLERYFNKRGEHYVVNKALRENLLFSRHDLLQDPPFSRMDMVACRNLLIYFKTQAQARALRLISNSLRDDGLLWLGASESVGDLGDHYVVLDPRWKLFATRPSRKRTLVSPLRPRAAHAAGEGTRQRRDDRVRAVLEQIQTTYVPPCAVVDENLRLLYRFGELDRFLSLPQGAVSLDVRDLLPSELSGLVSTAIGRLRDADEAVYQEVSARLPTETVRFDLRVRKLLTDGSAVTFALFFEVHEDRELEVAPHHEEVSGETRDHIEMLERELRLSRENLQATIEELESSNEELQATNEELVAANEELQSTNEELQSVNEELHTVNAEHGERLEELGQLNDDLDDLFRSIDIALLFLDPNLTIRRFNQACGRYFNILEHDEGRPLAHLSHRLDYNALLDDCASVLRSGAPSQRRVQADDETIIVRLMPQVSRAYGTQGVVVSFTDITSVEDSQAQVRHLTTAIAHSATAICFIDPEDGLANANPAFEARSGYDGGALAKRSWPDLLPEAEQDRGRELLASVRAGRPWRGMLRLRAAGGDEYFEVVQLTAGGDGSATLVHIGEGRDLGFKAYDRVREEAEPASLGRPAYSLWGPDPAQRVLDDGLAELLGHESNDAFDLANPATFAQPEDAESLRELLSATDMAKSETGYAFHTFGETDRRRLLARVGTFVQSSHESRFDLLLEVVELPPGPSGWCSVRS